MTCFAIYYPPRDFPGEGLYVTTESYDDPQQVGSLEEAEVFDTRDEAEAALRAYPLLYFSPSLRHKNAQVVSIGLNVERYLVLE